MRDPRLDDLLQRRGAVSRIARGLGISTAAVSRWRRVPAKRADAVAAILGVQVADIPITMVGRGRSTCTKHDGAGT